MPVQEAYLHPAEKRQTEMHCLYRFHGPGHDLLYIGITMNPPERFRDHRDSKWWWIDIRMITIEHFDSRADLLAAERRAIYAEKPFYNITHNDNPNNDRHRPDEVCPACQRTARYDRGLDRYFHLDGTDNLECWAAISRGECGANV
jgi:predicted GIY-YIG superfamily endonuclease